MSKLSREAEAEADAARLADLRWREQRRLLAEDKATAVRVEAERADAREHARRNTLLVEANSAYEVHLRREANAAQQKWVADYIAAKLEAEAKAAEAREL